MAETLTLSQSDIDWRVTEGVSIASIPQTARDCTSRLFPDWDWSLLIEIPKMRLTASTRSFRPMGREAFARAAAMAWSTNSPSIRSRPRGSVYFSILSELFCGPACPQIRKPDQNANQIYVTNKPTNIR